MNAITKIEAASPLAIDALKPLAQWLGWKSIVRKGKPANVPFNPNTGRAGDSTDAKTWGTFAQAQAWAAKHKGSVGLVLGRVQGLDAHISGIDLDGCIGDLGEVTPWAQAVLDKLPQAYWEISPSEKGLKGYVLADGAGKTREFDIGNHTGMSFYAGERYFAFTGEAFEGSKPELLPMGADALEWFYAHGARFKREHGKSAPADGESGWKDESQSGVSFRLAAEGQSLEAYLEALDGAGLAEYGARKRSGGQTQAERDWERAKGKFGGELEFEDLGPDEPEAGKPKAFAITAQPAEDIDFDNIPETDWLYGKIFGRKILSCLIAPGSSGKSGLALTEALAMATGRDLLGTAPKRALKVWYINLEDPWEEVTRRRAAAMQRHEITNEELRGQLFVNGRMKDFTTARQTKSGATVLEPVFDALKSEIERAGIDVLMVDPFVSTHALDENDNASIDKIAKRWAFLADECGIAVQLAHHTRKQSSGENRDYDVDDGRGAKALIDASRVARVINVMREDTHKKLALDGWHKWFIRIDDGKASYGQRLPTSAADWLRLLKWKFQNGTDALALEPAKVTTEPEDFEDLDGSPKVESVKLSPRELKGLRAYLNLRDELGREPSNAELDAKLAGARMFKKDTTEGSKRAVRSKIKRAAENDA